MTHRTGFHDGRLGIGLEINGGGDGSGKPRYPLDINGDIRLSGAIVDSSGNPIQMMAQQRTFPNAITTVEREDIGDGTVFGAGTFKLNGLDTYYNDGNVGIGTDDPGIYKLKVNGSMYVNSLELSGGDIQTQLGGKQATIGGAASTITSSNLETSKALITDTAGKVGTSNITSTELGWLSGATSSIQTQLGTKQNTLTTNARLNANCIGDNNLVSNTEYGYLNGVTSAIQTQINGKASTSSIHWSKSTGYLYYNGGNVGIGTTSPYAQLEVTQSVNSNSHIRIGDGNHNSASSPAVYIYPVLTYYARSNAVRRNTDPLFSGPGNTGGCTAAICFTDRPGTYTYASAVRTSDITFYTALSTIDNISLGQYPRERMRITADGNVGIGTTNPGAPLEIYKKGHASNEKGGAIILSRYVHGVDGATSSNSPYRGSCIWHEHNGSNDCMMFRSSSGTNPYTLSPAHMVLTNAGNVGIGDTGPDYPLEITRSKSNHSNSTPEDDDGDGGSCNLCLKNSFGGYGGSHNYQRCRILFKHANGGLWGVRTQSIISSMPYGTNNHDGSDLKFYVRSWGNAGGGTQYAGSMFLHTKMHYNGTLYVPSGGVNASGSGLTSDDRLKHNEKNITNALDSINKLKLKRYIKTHELYEKNHNFVLDNSGNPLDNSGNPLREHDDYFIEAGFIAQEVRNIPEFTEFVDGEEYKEEVIEEFEKNPSGEPILDENGNIIVTNRITKQVPNKIHLNYNNLFCYHIQATQELHKEQQADKAEIAALENKVATLESTLETVLARITELENK